jgi:hypothetical protein
VCVWGYSLLVCVVGYSVKVSGGSSRCVFGGHCLCLGFSVWCFGVLVSLCVGVQCVGSNYVCLAYTVWGSSWCVFGVVCSIWGCWLVCVWGSMCSIWGFGLVCVWG